MRLTDIFYLENVWILWQKKADGVVQRPERKVKKWQHLLNVLQSIILHRFGLYGQKYEPQAVRRLTSIYRIAATDAVLVLGAVPLTQFKVKQRKDQYKNRNNEGRSIKADKKKIKLDNYKMEKSLKDERTNCLKVPKHGEAGHKAKQVITRAENLQDQHVFS